MSGHHPHAATGPIVVKIGGGALDGTVLSHELFGALAGLVRRESRGVVIVHGGGSAVDDDLRAVGLEPIRREGIRITPPEHIGIVVGVLAGRINTAVVGAMKAAGAPSVGLCLGDADIETEIDTSFGFDAGRVGAVVGGDGQTLSLLLGAGLTPVVSSIGLDADGKALNVNADTAAAGIARVLGASELLLLTDVPGILDAEGERIDELDANSIDELIAAGVVKGGMIPKALAARDAADHTGAMITIATWRERESLAALGRGHRIGTRVASGALRRRRPEPAARLA